MKKSMVALLLTCLAVPAWAVSPGDWPNYGYTQGGGRFSPLTQITPTNVAKLAPAWIYHMNPSRGEAAAAAPAGRAPSSETTPLVVGGILYLGTPFGRVVALDADSGSQIWAYALPAGNQPAQRGIAYWPGEGKAGPEIVFGTSGGKLIALSAKTGEPVPGFGEDGVVNTKTPEIMNGLPNAPYAHSSPPSIYKNLIIMGSHGGEEGAKGAAGDVRAWDAVTGKLVWTFHSIPRPGEKGHDTWEGDSWRQRSGVNVWGMMTVDAARGIVYMPFGAPTFDRYGGDRKGANLYANTLVAADAATGKYLWHFQVAHHEVWDDDLDTPPVLIEVKKDGKVIPAVTAMNKTGLLFILNRITGEPIFGVTETPVPSSPVPSEQVWPTQPIPNKPVQLARSSFALNEVATVTPELRAFCQAWIDRDHLQPSVRYQPIPSDYPIIRFPGGEGGPEWAGGAFDPTLGYYIVNTNNLGYVEKLVQKSDGEWFYTKVQFKNPDTRMECQQPPWGNLTAINVNTGEIAWRINLGVSDALPAGAQNTGRLSNGGPILTASGLTFIGGTEDERFRAFDSKTGKELWTYKLDHSANATPITYRGKNGKQYVAVVATGGTALFAPPGGDSLLAFALP